MHETYLLLNAKLVGSFFSFPENSGYFREVAIQSNTTSTV